MPASAVSEVIERGRARADKEAVMFAKLRAGSTTVELLSLNTTPVRRV